MNKIKLFLVVATCVTMFGIGIHHRQDISSAMGLSGGNECEVALGCARCGDGQCQKSCGENARTCPRDCGGTGGTASKAEAASCARCGDGVCAKKCENERTCPRDCGGTSSAGPSE